MAQQVFVVDAGVEDADTLLVGIPTDALVVRLDAGSDGVLQLAAALASLENVSALHIFSHGEAGALLLGSARLDAGSMDSYASALAQMRGALSVDADILLYGCNVAKGDAGGQFIDALAAATGADVAASTDLTGAGGDWMLERSTGAVESVLVVAEGYSHALAVIPGTSNPETLNGTSYDDTITGLAGDDALNGYQGNDLLNGGTGADTMNGYTGNDIYVVDNALDVIQGEEDFYVYVYWSGYVLQTAGWDTVQTSVNDTTLGSFLENLTLTGSALKGTGNTADNVMTGNAGSNTLDGADGNDTVYGGAGNDSLVGGIGIDTVTYAGTASAISVTLSTLSGQNTGGSGTDTISGFENAIGSGYADTLVGTLGDNQLYGKSGDDVLNGGRGNDTLEGSAGADRAVYVGNAEDFRFGWRADGYLISVDLDTATNDYGTDAMRGVETLRFDNRNYTFAPGGEFRVSTQTAFDQTAPAITSLVGGGFVVTWQSYDSNTEQRDIYAQVYDASGAFKSDEVRVNSLVSGDQTTPVVSALADGGFAIAWRTQVDGGSDVYVRRFGALGGATAEEVQVHSSSSYGEYAPAMATLNDGNFVVVWTSYSGQDGDSYGVFARIFDDQGVAQSGDIFVNQYTTSDQYTPSVSATSSGGFVVAWTSYGQDTSSEGVYARRFDSVGDAATAEYAVNTGTTFSSQNDADVTTFGDGSSVVVWTSNTYNPDTQAYDNDIWAQRFDSSGTGSGEFRVNVNNSLEQNGAAVETLSDGGFVVVWVSDTAQQYNYEIYSRRYNAAGGTVTNDVLVNVTTSLNQIQPDVTALSDGGYVVTWTSLNQDGSSYGVFARRFDASNQSSNPTLTGTIAADVLDISGDGDLVAVGGAGNDLYRINSVGDVVRENPSQGDDTIESSVTLTLPGNVERLVLLDAGGGIDGYGNTLDNTVTGNASDNFIDGGSGNDTLVGGAGDDVLYGWDGDDVYYVDSGFDYVGSEGYYYFYDFYGFDTVYSSVDWQLNSGLNDLILTGSASLGYGNYLSNRITGTSGNNTLSGSYGYDTLIGGAGNDYLDGGPNYDTASYADAVSGVTIDLTNPNEQDSGGSGIEKLFSIEHLIGTSQADNFTGNDDLNYLQGGAGGDSLSGGAAADTLDGGSGPDTLAGGAGDDLYIVDGIGDVLEGEVDGTDTVRSAVGWTLASELENLELTGAATINGTGNESANAIVGNDAANNLNGLGGDDGLTGGFGNDTLNGGDGADALHGGAGSDNMSGGTGNDTINGGVFTDTARFTGNAGTFQFGMSAGGELLVKDMDTAVLDEGTDQLRNIDTLNFGDQNYAVRDGELQLNTNTVGNQENVALAGRPDGSFVSVWQGLASDGTTRIYGQLFDANGVTQGFQFRVDTAVDDYSRYNPAVAALPGGGYVVTWQSYGQDGDWGVYAQRYSAAGARAGGEFKVNSTTADSQVAPAIAVLSDGDFVISWSSNNQDGSGLGIYAQRYNSSGVTLGSEFLVNTTTAADQTYSSIAAVGTGFVVTWSSDDTSGFGVYGQRFDGDGVAAGSEFQVNSNIPGTQYVPSVAGLTGGGYVVTWTSDGQDGDGWGIYGRVYSSNGTPGDEFLVNTGYTSLGQYGSTVSALSDGGFVISWHSDGQDGSGTGVYARRYNSNAVAQGASEFRVNTFTTNSQFETASTALANGGFVIGWTSSGGQDDSGYSVHAQRFDSQGQARLTQIAGNANANTIDLSGPGAISGAGGAGNDIYLVNDNLLDRVVELSGGGLDTVRTTADWTLSDTIENLTLEDAGGGITGTGNPFSNKIIGNDSNNTLTGGAGNDTLDGLGGSDNMIGGTGNDTYWMSESGEISGISEDSNQGTDTVRSPVTVTLVPGQYVENIVLTESVAPNVNATGNGLANAITGNSGVNALSGGGGNDTLTGGGGADVLRGNSGDDLYNADVSDDLAEDLGGGTDTVSINNNYVLLANFEYLVLTGTNPWTGTGNTGLNNITGNSGNNTLDGGAGVDTLIGGGGSDTFLVDNTGDVITELVGGGADKIISTALDTLLASQVEDLDLLLGSSARNGTGNALNNVINGNDNPNDIDGGVGADTMAGGKDDDHYKVDNAGDVVDEELGEGGNDQVESSIANYTLTQFVEDLVLAPGSANLNGTGNASSNELIGNDGNNALDGKTGVDTMTGGLGNDTFYVDQTADTIVEVLAQGNDTIIASASFVLAPNVENLKFTNPVGGTNNYTGTGNGTGNLIEGGAGNDELNGLGGNDTLKGFAGDDTLIGGAGVDSMVGGIDNDLYIVDDANDKTVELIGEGDDRVESSVSYTLAVYVERLRLTGVDDINGTGNALGNHLDGNSGANNLIGNAGDDSIDGGGEGEADTMDGGAGDDTYYVDNEFDDVIEGATLLGDGADPHNAAGSSNIDTVIAQVSYTLRSNVENLILAGDQDLSGNGNESNNILNGNNGSNLLQGKAGVDILGGGLGDDTIDGGTGDDTMGGGAGDDTYIVDNQDDVLLPEGSSQGSDTVQSSLNWTLATNYEKLVLTGGALNGNGNSGDNTLNGNAADNLLKGVGGDDKLLGFAGSDKLYGGLGRDTLTGGADIDRFVFDTGLGTDNVDQIADFVSGTDRILLDDDIFSRFDASVTTVLGGAKFYASNGNIAHDATDRIIYNTNTGALYYDQDGTGPLGGIKFAVLVDAPALSAADFVITA